MRTPEDQEVAAAHEMLREAVRRCDIANHARAAKRAREAGDIEQAEFSDGRVEFMRGAVLVDYVVGSMYVDLADGDDYHAVSVTDGQCPVHRPHGLSSITTKFLRDL